MTASIGSVVNASFVELFQKSGGGKKIDLSPNAANQTNSLKKDSADFSTGLQTGAYLYAQSMNVLASGASYINVSRVSLMQLGELTDKMIDVAKRATHTNGAATLKNLNHAFRKLADEFLDILDNAEINGREYLKNDGLKELFQDIGLDVDSSTFLASMFDDFIFAKSDRDKNLASDRTAPDKDAPIPVSAFKSVVNRPYTKDLTQISDSNEYDAEEDDIIDRNIAGFVGGDYSVHQTYTSYNDDSGYSSIHINGPQGEHTLRNNRYDLNLKTINSDLGYSVVESKADLMHGQNTGHFSQLFLIDDEGHAIHQLTNMNENVTFGDVALSQDNFSVLYSTSKEVDSEIRNSLVLTNCSNFGSDPSGNNERVIASDSLSSFGSLSISSDSSHIAYIEDNGATTAANLKDYATLTSDATLLGFSDITNLGFVGKDTIAATNSTGVATFTNGDAALNQVYEGSATNLVTTENGFDGYFAVSEAGNLNLYNAFGKKLTSYDGYDDANTTVSLSIGSGKSPVVGFFGKVDEVSDPDKELYRVSITGGPKEVRRGAAVTRPDALMSGGFKLNSKAAGYVALDRLNSIKEQINNNLKELDKSIDYIQENINIAQAAGLALYNVSDQIRSEDDAASIARKLCSEIARLAPADLEHVHNLKALAQAAMQFDK